VREVERKERGIDRVHENVCEKGELRGNKRKRESKYACVCVCV
jgi:hypothetical protein